MRRMRQYSPRLWISFSLTCPTISVSLSGDALFWLSLNSFITVVTYPQALCEALSVQ